MFNNIINIDLLRKSIKKIKSRYPFKIDAFVLLPDHLHCIWTLPHGDDDYPLRWRLIKSDFTKMCAVKNPLTIVRERKGEQCIWQRRYWEHQIRDEDDFYNHVDYIHYNPVKHGYVKLAIDWPYSSFHHYVQQKIYNKNWGMIKEINIDNE